MTEDYKKNLIDYATGLLNQEEPRTEDFNIKSIDGYEFTSEDWSIVVDSFRLQRIGINGILENEKYENFILYGAYTEDIRSDTKGFLIYLDKNGKPYYVLKLNTRGILWLGFDEETNRVYGVESTSGLYHSFVPTQLYFMYYNNLFLTDNETNKPIETYTYNIYTSASGTPKFRVQDMIKDPTSSSYLIVLSSTNGGRYSRVYELKVNVGQSNELIKWDVNQDYVLFADYIWYSNGSPHFKLIEYYNLGFKLATNNDTNIVYTNLTTDEAVKNADDLNEYLKCVAINENEIYFVYHLTTTSGTIISYQSILYKYNGTSIETIYKTIEKQTDSSVPEPIYEIPMMNLVIDEDNTIYVLEYESDSSIEKTNVKLCKLENVNEPSKWINIGNFNQVWEYNIYNQRATLRRNYNIANIFSFSGYIRGGHGLPSYPINGFEVNIQDLAPINGYVGEPYVNVDALSPLYSNLYSNGSLVFSRNLYNISKQNNMSMSSVEIPNSYLNDTTITQNDLISETNLELVEDTTEWTKNIYEVVDLNFLNTIRVIDEDTGTEYIDSSIKLNNATVDGGDTNYQNTPCIKYRINYQDSTTSIHNLVWNTIDDTHKETEISFYVDKAIFSIDLLSNDESTIYISIPLNVEVGKYYTINQKIRIGG